MIRRCWLLLLLLPLPALASDNMREVDFATPPTLEHPRVLHLMPWQRSNLPPALVFPVEKYPAPRGLDRAELLKYLEYRQQLSVPTPR